MGGLYTAEVTAAHGSGPGWRTSHPMRVVDLVLALKSIGCDKKEIDDAFEKAWLQEFHKWAEEIAHGLRSALLGNRQVPQQSAFSEAWIGYALLYNHQKFLSLEEVLQSADSINHAI